jgi:rod shape-determining protein MreD
LTTDAITLGALVFVAAVLQSSVFGGVVILGGTPNLLLVTLVAVALLRGSIVGACAGFLGGLVLDTANLEILGVTSLLLAVAGYWAGRLAETVHAERRHMPYLVVAVVTVLYLLGALALRFFLGQPAPARVVLLETLFQSIALNLILTWPAYALTRRVAPLRAHAPRLPGVSVD